MLKHGPTTNSNERMARSSRIIATVVAALIAGAVAAFAVAWRPTIAAIAPPAPLSFDPALVKRGRDLAAVGNCNTCHTVRGGQELRRRPAGADAVRHHLLLQHHAGRRDRNRAMVGSGVPARHAHRRRSRGPASVSDLPYDHFTNVSDEDDRALYAFLMTRPPVPAPARKTCFPFRSISGRHRGVEIAVPPPRGFQPEAGKSAEWIRGAYLVEGSPIAAPAIRRATRWVPSASAPSSPAAMSTIGSPCPERPIARAGRGDADALYAYLRHGWHPDHGTARGPMAEWSATCRRSPQRRPRDRGLHGRCFRRTVAGPQASGRGGAGAGEIAARRLPRIPPRRRAIYAAACAGCHEAAARYPMAGSISALSTTIVARSTQSRQHRAVRRESGRRRTQPDHAGLCRQHERRADRGAVELSARPLQRAAGLERR